MALFDLLRGANQFETFFKVAAVCFAFILVCSCCIGCAIRARLCGCGRGPKKTHPATRKRTERADEVLVNEFFRRYPIQKPGRTVDVEAPVTFHYLRLEDPMPTNRFFRKDGRLVFDDRNGARKKVGQHLTDVMTVQASRILAGPSPDSINPVNGVYYEVEIEALGMMVSKEGNIEPTQVCIGWASTPYPPFEIVGNARFSLGLFSDGRVLASRLGPYDDNTLLHGGFREGDVVGAGYELDREGGVIEFYFTHNGRRLPPLPNDCGVYDLHKARKYSAPDPLGNENSKAKRRRRSSVVGASVLAGGSAYPTVTAIGPAVLEPHFSGPYVYERGTFGRGDSLRRDLVHKMFGNAKSNTRVTRGRRHTATAAAGLEAWALFAQRAAMEGKDLLDGASGFNHKDEPEKPRWSMGGPSQQADEEESSDDERYARAPAHHDKRGRRLSAPAAMLGDAVKGWADRAAAVRVTRRTGLGARVKQLVGSNLQEIMGGDIEDGGDEMALNASSATITRQRRASMSSHVSHGSRASMQRRLSASSAASGGPRGRRASLGSAASNMLQRRLSGASAASGARQRRASVGSAVQQRRSSLDAATRTRLQRRLSGASASSAASAAKRARRHSMSSTASNHSNTSRSRNSVAARRASIGKRRRKSMSSAASPRERRGSRAALVKRQSTLDSDDADALPMEPTPSRGSRQRRHSISSATGNARRNSTSSVSRKRRGSGASLLKTRRHSNASNASNASVASLARSRGSNASMASLARSRASFASASSHTEKKRRRSIGGKVSPSVAKAGRRVSRGQQRRPSMSGDSIMDVNWKAGGLGVGGDEAGARGGRRRRGSLGLPSPVAGGGKVKLRPLNG